MKIKRSKRTIPPKKVIKKSIRTKYPFLLPELLRVKTAYGNWGGHLVSPDKKCSHKKFVDNNFWADLGCCPDCDNQCDRFLWFKKASKKDRLNDLRARNVRI